MEHLKISLIVSDINRDDAIDVVNNIQNNMYDNIKLHGIGNSVIPCYEVVVDTFTLKGEPESIDVISNKTMRYEYVESNSKAITVGDVVIIDCDFYNIVYFEERWFLYSFATNKAIYSYENIKSKEELREKLSLEYENTKFYKRI